MDWIDVNFALPEKSGKYAVWYKRGTIGGLPQWGEGFFNVKLGIFSISAITHWAKINPPPNLDENLLIKGGTAAPLNNHVLLA